MSEININPENTTLWYFSDVDIYHVHHYDGESVYRIYNESELFQQLYEAGYEARNMGDIADHPKEIDCYIKYEHSVGCLGRLALEEATIKDFDLLLDDYGLYKYEQNKEE